MTFRTLLLAAALAAPGLARADPADDGARVIFELRARSETVAQEGLHTGHALTVRPRLGWRSERRWGLQALVEGEAVVVLDDRFSAPLRPDPSRPVVGDSEVMELNRAQLSWRPAASTEAIVGRQRIVLDDGRFLGNSAWRQNEQTFDALRVTTSAVPGVDLTLVHAEHVRRFPGGDHPQGVWSGAVQAVAAGTDTMAGRLSALYLTSDFAAQPNQSLRTWVIGLQGERPVGDSLSVTWRFDYGRQDDFGANPADFTVDYARAGVGLHTSSWSVQFGREWLEGDGVAAFQTPLGSNHAYLGWSDVIGATPAYGLADDFIQVRGALPEAAVGRPLRLAFEAHAFRDAQREFEVGREFDASASVALGPHWSLEAKAARFESERPEYADASKFWLTLEYRY